ncbi:glucuronide carrier protein [Raineyella antarctica]|uniref:Glucuronide carrier protein n=1 Tax=Raineyella antarctica TaxID=1577474 RepID=A0A1G6H423_9ACTN|nr:glycoside-pentoside-hexuronide (GPH):cation symporter [Raineyella antarctica]SDB88921.1 glucuronide carrier protein [Raineyella antarctica]
MQDTDERTASETDRQGLRAITYWGYAAGDVANNMTFSMISAFLLVYYTDVAGIAAATAGTLFLVVRVWGGLTDLVAGATIDRTRTRWGRFRPYLVFGSVPLLASLVAVFTVPAGLPLAGRIVWAYATYALFSLLYSFVNVPYGSLAASVTQRSDERTKLSAARSLGAASTGLLIAIVVSPQVAHARDLQHSLTISTIGFAVAGVALYLFCFATSTEAVAPRRTARPSAAEMVRALTRNVPLALLCLQSVVVLAATFAMGAVAMYFARDVLGDANLFAILTLAQTVGMILAAMAVPRTVARVGQKRSYMVALAVAVVGCLGLVVVPAGWVTVAVVLFGIVGFGIGVVNTLVWSIQADTVDYGEWITGKRSDGTNYSLVSFSRKVGQGLGGAVAGWILAAGHYGPTAGHALAPQAAMAVRGALAGFPALALLVAFVAMWRYPLSEQRHDRILADLRSGTHPGSSGRV